MEKIILHIDVNSAFLSWSALERLKKGDPLDIRTVPSIIGGDRSTRHGIVLAKSIPARACGIHTAEPVASALKKCPDLIIEPPCHDRYREYSRQLMALLRTFTPDIEQVSVDECYLDFGPIAHRNPPPEIFARQVADRVREELGFTVNVGVSYCKILAKMASDMEKPDRVHTLWREEIPAKLWPLPVEELHMVGRSSAARLHALGIHTIGQLAATDVHTLESHFHSHGQTMWNYANGLDDRDVVTESRAAASVGHSTTLSRDCTDSSQARDILRHLSEKVAARLRRYGQLAGSVTVEIKYSSFRRTSRQAPLLSPTDTALVIYEEARRLFAELWNGEPIRLLGISTGRLVNPGEPVQLSLFDLEAGTSGFDTRRSFDTRRKKAAAPCSGPAPASPPAPPSPEPPESTSAAGSASPARATAPEPPEITPAAGSAPPADLHASHAARLRKHRQLELAMDSIRARYGQDAIARGELKKKNPPPEASPGPEEE